MAKEICSPFQYSCLENSMDKGAWPATVHGLAKYQTQLSMHVHTHTHTHSLLSYRISRRVVHYSRLWHSHLVAGGFSMFQSYAGYLYHMRQKHGLLYTHTHTHTHTYNISFWLHWMLAASCGLFVVTCRLLFNGGARASEHGLNSCSALE